jgi:hypothetical protein
MRDMPEWTESQRDAAQAFLAEAMPIPRAMESRQVEVEMPPNWRRGFGRLFKRLAPPAAEAPPV